MGEEGVRLDIWLDVACITRTRAQAKDLCDGGKVEVGGSRAKSHRLVRPGDRIVVTLGTGPRRELVVRAVRETHIAKALARELYEDVTPPPSPDEIERQRIERFAPPPSPTRGSGRPEKRSRRQMDRIRGR